MTFDDWWGAYPTQEDYEANCRNAWGAGAAIRDAEIATLRELKQAWHDKFWEADKQLAAAQARIDELMLEYCPDEMTQDQIDNWAKHQQAVPENELPEFLRKP